MTIKLPCEPEAMLAKLNEGVCPYCERTGFKKVFTHISFAHGVVKNELKDVLLIRRTKGFVDPELRKIMQKNGATSYSNNFRESAKRVSENFKSHQSVSIEKMKKISRERDSGAQLLKIKDDAEIQKKRISNLRFTLAKDTLAEKIMKTLPRTKAHYGTERGYPDIFYAQAAQEFIVQYEHHSISIKEVFRRMALKHSLSWQTFRLRIETAKKRNLIYFTRSEERLIAKLTKKALLILETKTADHSEGYEFPATQQGK